MLSFPKKTVYLAGPITGLTHDEARFGWRREFAKQLQAMGHDHIYCSSPMRGKDFLRDHGKLGSDQDLYSDNPMATSAGIMTRDFNDVKTGDAMVACFLESNGILSGGTFMEYGIAHTLQKPIIGIGPKDDVNLSHLMAARVIGYRVDTLEEGAIIVGHLLTPAI
jgi:nucleoside 2-deoxyribosyltransferase